MRARAVLGALSVLSVLSVLALAGAARAGNVTVVRELLTFDETHELEVNLSLEYILQFLPSAEQSLWPVRVWLQADGGDTARPLLVTARRRTGATTWQLPYRAGDALLFELERTLCPDDSADVEELSEYCDDPTVPAGQMWLHVSTSCGAPVRVRLRAQLARDWLLAFGQTTTVHTSLAAPRVQHYRFGAGERSVRLVLASRDDVCALVAVHNYTCPILQNAEDLESSMLRMTVQRSGGTQISASRYPRGFYVVAVVLASDERCAGPEPAQDDWLWEAAVLRDEPAPEPAAPAAPAPERLKTLTVTLVAPLSRGQYALGASVTLLLFAMFYVVFGALVLAQRIPRWKKLVGPKAKLANTNGPPESTRAELESAMSGGTRRRRDSTATFDSSDMSDTDDEDEQPMGTTTTVITTHDTQNNIHDVSVTEPARGSGNNTSDISSLGRGSTAVCSPETELSVAVDDLPTAGPASAPQLAATSARVHPADHDDQQAQDGARPFGLPARLRVAALARRRGRVLAARSDRYLYALATVALFYALPVLQFVAAFQLILNVTGSLDMCYYNFLCAHPAGALSDFNHVFSNMGYLLLGALFMLQVRRRRLRRKRKPRDEEYGIPAHYGLLSSLGAAMMMVALLSATYHVCPNGLNFQFDTAFMYVLAVLSMVKIYQARHPDINARAHATFAALALLLALGVWGVLGGGPLFWSVFTVLHVFTFLLLSLRIYYVGQFRLEKASVAAAAAAARQLAAPAAWRPLYTPRLLALLVANAVNWAFALYGLFTQGADFASHLLGVLLGNTLLYMVFYLAMKLVVGERLRWYVWVHLAAATAAWAPALYFFLSGSTDWSTTPALSRHQNHECLVMQFYDSHDLWHMLSAVALYFTFNVLLTWDDGLSAVLRTQITVF